jgi:hypothetical protein
MENILQGDGYTIPHLEMFSQGWGIFSADPETLSRLQECSPRLGYIILCLENYSPEYGESFQQDGEVFPPLQEYAPLSGYIFYTLKIFPRIWGLFSEGWGIFSCTWRMFPKVRDIFPCIVKYHQAPKNVPRNERNTIMHLKIIL